jgi:drug/metabolite transporter (DMT)-like permease
MQDSSLPRKSSAAHSHSVWALVAVVVANVALAFGPLFVRVADVGPVSAGFWRLALATPVLFVAARAIGERPVQASRGLWGVLAIAGLAFAADLASWHIGIVRTTLANSTLFGNSATFIFPIYGFVAARMWPSRIQALALLLAAVGAALLLGRSASLSSKHLAGDLFCMLAGVLYAVYFIFMARARTRLAPVPALALSSLATIPPLLILALALGEQVLPGNWWPLIALAVISQLIGQGCMIYALGHLSPLVVGIALLVQPAVAAALGWIVFDERLATADAIGAILVAAALVLVRQSSRPPQSSPARGGGSPQG